VIDLQIFCFISVFIVPYSQNFTPNNNNTQAVLRQNLINIINLAFLCSNNPTDSSCVETKRRRKRQTSCPYNYNVDLSNIQQVNKNQNNFI
jgi:hypothetical protein